MNRPITAERLRELLHYDPLTGAFVWKAWRGGHAHAGSPAGRPDSSGYLQISVDGKRYLAHRLAWLYMIGSLPNGVIDHRDTVRSNNRWANLRDVSCRVNNENRRTAHPTNQSGVMGAHQERDHFRSSLRVHGKQVHLGMFSTADEAHAAYVAAKRELHEGNTL